AVGVLFAFILLTRDPLVNAMHQALIDLPFLALVLAAASLAAETPQRTRAIWPPLIAAGLLRPEGWMLAVLYGAYLWPGRDRRGRTAIAIAVAAAPLVWLFFDLAATGDPLWSFHGTRTTVEKLGLSHGIG